MLHLDDHKTWAALAFCMAFCLLLATRIGRESQAPLAGPGSEQLRAGLEQMKTQALVLERTLASLPGAREGQQVRLMASAAAALSEELLPALVAEERDVYPILDRQAPGSAIRFTEPLREELKLVRRWTRELEDLANASWVDESAFIRRGERLLGLLEAHVAVDQSVVIPYLDREATPPRIATVGGFPFVLPSAGRSRHVRNGEE